MARATSSGWGEIPGVTTSEGRPQIPRDPAQVVDLLADILALARSEPLDLPALVHRLRERHGLDRSRLGSLVSWLASSHVARFGEAGVLDVHPGTSLQDVAFRLGAWAGVQDVPADQVDGLQKWVHELMRLATSHERALTRASADPSVARSWLGEHAPPELPEDLDDPPHTARLRALLAHLDAALLERATHVRAVLLALLAGQHALLLGPPGTAKSLLARSLCAGIDGATYFEYLLSRFTHPDELFGPVSIPGLKDEDYRRLTEGFLPQAHVAFLDEVFKANSAILNSLLTLVNERVFHHGRHRDPSPLLGLVGASNELPEPDAGLDALYDRFLVRLAVPPLGQPESFLAVATGSLGMAEVPQEQRLHMDEIADIRQRARDVELGEGVPEALTALWRQARSSAWPVSDRRWRQAVGLLKVAVASDGRALVQPIDLLLLEPCLAWDPAETPAVRAALLAHLQPASAPAHDLAAQWTLLWSDRVAPTPEDPVPPGDPPADWRGRLERRRKALDRFLVHHEQAVQRLGLARQELEALGERHLWLPEMPIELLEPHLEAARELTAWLRRAERHAARLRSVDALIDTILGYLALEDRVRPEHMDMVLGIGEGHAVGLAYRQWRRVPGPYEGPTTVYLDEETFMDWLDGTRSTTSILAGVGSRERQRLIGALPVLHDALAPRRIPDPGDA